MSEMTDTPVRRPHSALTVALDAFVRLCGIVPYMLAGLVLRLVMAWQFFVSGQAMIEGPRWPVAGPEIVLAFPARLREETLHLFDTRLADTAFSARTMAYVVAYAEFVLPILLFFGLATRSGALALIGLLVFMDRYIAADLFWSWHVYAYAILLTLMSCGAGLLSVDRIIRYFSDR